MRTSFICLYFIVLSLGVSAQDSFLNSIGVKPGKMYSITDSSIVRKINRTALDSAYSNAQLAETYARISIGIADQIEYFEGLIDAYLTMSVAKIYLNDNDSALVYCNKGLRTARRNKLNEQEISCLDMRGSVYSFQEKYDLAVTDYLSAIKLAEKTGSDKVIKSYGNLGYVFNKTGNVKKAEYYLKLSVEAGKRLDQPNAVASSLNNLGLLEKNRGNTDQALKYYFEGLEYTKKKNFKARESELLYNISVIYFDRGEFDKAMEYFESSLEISKENEMYSSVAISYSTLGQNLYEIGKKKEGWEATKVALEYAELSGNHEILIEVYGLLAEMSKQEGKDKEAFEYLSKAYAYKDSLQLSEINNAIASAENQYEQEKKDLKIEMERKKEQEVNDQKLHTRDLLLWFSFGVLVIVMGGVFYLYRINKKVKSRNKLVEQQKSEIEVQHKEITDSINYAQRIQSAIIANEDYWTRLSQQHCVFFRPKDVVSGDFHWVYNDDERNLAVWAVADCTGHGVPGAFMSMLGIGFLNEIVIDDKQRDPAQILNELRRKIITALDSESKDGMDISLCVWDRNTNEVQYAGANNSLYLVRESAKIDDSQYKSVVTIKGSELSLAEIEADKMPIGKYYGVPPSFKTRRFKVLEGDTIILFTDGFADQFGGTSNKKYKYRQLKEFLLRIHGESFERQKDLLNKEFDSWKGSNEQTDDVCLVSVRLV